MAKEEWSGIQAHQGGSNVPHLGPRVRTEAELGEAIDRLGDLMEKLLEAITALTDQIAQDSYDRKYGKKGEQNIGKPPWEARPTSPFGQESLDPNKG